MSLCAVTGCSAPAVDVRGLGRVFGDKVALRGLSLEVAAGEIHALVGPNGAGKTTLLRILSGFTAPSEGTVRVAGRDPARGGHAHRATLGIVPAGDRSFYLRISGLENLLFFGRMHGLGKRAAVDRSLELLDQVGLADAARVPVRSYSQGMKKRLSIARGLLADPRVLLLDEATHDLDPAGARDVRELVTQRAASGTASLWATQRIEEIRGFAARVTLLDAGRVRFSGPTEEFLSRGVDAEAAFLVVAGSEGRR